MGKRLLHGPWYQPAPGRVKIRTQISRLPVPGAFRSPSSWRWPPGFVNWLLNSFSVSQAWDASGNWTPLSLSPVLSPDLAWPGGSGAGLSSSGLAMQPSRKMRTLQVLGGRQEVSLREAARLALSNQGSESPSPPGPSLGHVSGLSMLGLQHTFPVLWQPEYLKFSG